MKTIGYEIEFQIPPYQLESYSLLYNNPQTDNFGFDVFNMRIAEYRSNVFNTTEELLIDYQQFKNKVKRYSALFLSEDLEYTYGIHISFDNYSKLKLLFMFLYIFFLNHPLLCLKRMIRIEWFRQHKNRLEFRLIPTLENDFLFRKFVNLI